MSKRTRKQREFPEGCNSGATHNNRRKAKATRAENETLGDARAATAPALTAEQKAALSQRDPVKRLLEVAPQVELSDDTNAWLDGLKNKGGKRLVRRLEDGRLEFRRDLPDAAPVVFDVRRNVPGATPPVFSARLELRDYIRKCRGYHQGPELERVARWLFGRAMVGVEAKVKRINTLKPDPATQQAIIQCQKLIAMHEGRYDWKTDTIKPKLPKKKAA